MVEKQICCCGSSVWTKVIAWFQIIFAVFSIIGYSVSTVKTVALLANADNAKGPDPKTKLTPEEIAALKTELTVAIGGMGVMLILAVLSFVMGIMLLRGSKNRNPHQIHAWLVYAVIYVIVSTVYAITVSFAGPADMIVTNITTLLLVLAIQGFCLWVVGTHKREIEASG